MESGVALALVLPPLTPSHPYPISQNVPELYLYLPAPSLTTLLQALPCSFPHDFCVRLAQEHQGLNALRSLAEEEALRWAHWSRRKSPRPRVGGVPRGNKGVGWQGSP